MRKTFKRRHKKITVNNEIPEIFWERLGRIVGEKHLEDIRETFTQKPSTFRVNPLKSNKNEVEKELRELGFEFQEVAWKKE